MKSWLFVANWKMNKSFVDELDFCTKNRNALTQLSNNPGKEIVLCPSFISLFVLSEFFQNTLIRIGAQTCSAYTEGAYTGQVSAQSLNQIGCRYCIIGHSEQRSYLHTSQNELVLQVKQALSFGIQPIVCIGETRQELEQKKSIIILSQQLNPIISASNQFNQPITIAYEPIWAIGTGQIPKLSYLNTVFEWITQKLDRELSCPWRLLYGGSVDSNCAPVLLKNNPWNGLLIGRASLNFQNFEKIVLLEN